MSSYIQLFEHLHFEFADDANVKINILFTFSFGVAVGIIVASAIKEALDIINN